MSAWHYVAHTRGEPQDDERFISTLGMVVREYGYDVAVATWSAGITALSAYRDQLDCEVGYGSHDSVLAALDKQRLAEIALEAGLLVPRELPQGDADLVSYGRPVVVKATRESRIAAKLCTTAEAAAAHRDAILAAGGDPLVQEMLDEPMTSVSFVVASGEIVTYTQQEASLVWPLRAGSIARSTTTDVDPGLRAAVERLVTATGFHGIGQLQLLRAEDGGLRLIDFNPRYYGSIALAIAAGANEPVAWARMAVGLPVQPVVARPGVHYQWLSRDLQASIRARDARGVLQALTLAPRSVHSLWDSRDPLLAPRYFAGELARRTKDLLSSHGG